MWPGTVDVQIIEYFKPTCKQIFTGERFAADSSRLVYFCPNPVSRLSGKWWLPIRVKCSRDVYVGSVINAAALPPVSVTSFKRITRFVISRRVMNSVFFLPLKRTSPGTSNESRGIERAAPGAVNRYMSAVARTTRSFIAEHLFSSCMITVSRLELSHLE